MNAPDIEDIKARYQAALAWRRPEDGAVVKWGERL